MALIHLKARAGIAALTFAAVVAAPLPAVADAFMLSTGNPGGRIGTLSRPRGLGQLQTETADDFVLSQSTSLTQATFTGLIPSGANLSSITNVKIEFFHIFPTNSVNPPSGNEITRTNSPADVEIAAATRDALAGSLNFSTTTLNLSVLVLNTVVWYTSATQSIYSGEGSATGPRKAIQIRTQTKQREKGRIL